MDIAPYKFYLYPVSKLRLCLLAKPFYSLFELAVYLAVSIYGAFEQGRNRLVGIMSRTNHITGPRGAQRDCPYPIG